MRKRVNLSVNYTEKDKAKALGAKWDPKARTWFILEGSDPKKFSAWLFEEELQDALAVFSMGDKKKVLSFPGQTSLRAIL